jgi:hypothetical protein
MDHLRPTQNVPPGSGNAGPLCSIDSIERQMRFDEGGYAKGNVRTIALPDWTEVPTK